MGNAELLDREVGAAKFGVTDKQATEGNCQERCQGCRGIVKGRDLNWDMTTVAHNVLRFNSGFEPSLQLQSTAPQEKPYPTSKCKRTLPVLGKVTTHLIAHLPSPISSPIFHHPSHRPSSITHLIAHFHRPFHRPSRRPSHRPSHHPFPSPISPPIALKERCERAIEMGNGNG